MSIPTIFWKYWDCWFVTFSVEAHLAEVALIANERLKELECRLAEHDEAHARTLEARARQHDDHCRELAAELQSSRDRESDLLQRLNNCCTTENQLRDKVLASESEFAERLHLASARERELVDKLNQLHLRFEASESRGRALESQIKVSRNEILRHDIGSIETFETIHDDVNTNLIGHSFTNPTHMLQDEIKSLRCVLELKQNEITDLRKHNRELQNAHDELTKAQIRISGLESRIEELSIQYQTKVEEEK